MARAREITDPTAEHLVAAHQRIHGEKQEIDRAMHANPSDPALLGRIEKLTAEVESTDRAVLQRLNRQARRAFDADRPKRPQWHMVTASLPRSLTGFVRIGVILLVVTGIIYAVAGAHHSSRRGSPEATFHPPGPSEYTSGEIVSMVEHKVSEEGIFSPASETITCPEGTYATDSLVTCTLHSPKGGGSFNVEVTATGISIKMPDEAPSHPR
jgi:hypothetical protein